MSAPQARASGPPRRKPATRTGHEKASSRIHEEKNAFTIARAPRHRLHRRRAASCSRARRSHIARLKPCEITQSGSFEISNQWCKDQLTWLRPGCVRRDRTPPRCLKKRDSTRAVPKLAAFPIKRAFHQTPKTWPARPQRELPFREWRWTLFTSGDAVYV